MLNVHVFLYARLKKRDILWNSVCVHLSVCPSVNIKGMRIAQVYVLYLKKFKCYRSMKLVFEKFNVFWT